MRIRHRLLPALGLAAAVGAALLASSRPARAQIDPYRASYGVYESRDRAAPVLLGEIYRESTDRTTYVEHWVLYPGYVNPSPANGLTLTIRPNHRAYRDTRDFFARVPWSSGSRYVRVDSLDTDERPVARR